jgi:hypothetical protein
MTHPFLRPAIAAFIADLSVPLAAHLGLTRAMGAHPWWDTQVAWIGLALGLLLSVLASRLPARFAIPGLALATGLALWPAMAGQARFAASFASDEVAGQLWYFGWIAVATCAVALLALSAMTIVRR